MSPSYSLRLLSRSLLTALAIVFPYVSLAADAPNLVRSQEQIRIDTPTALYDLVAREGIHHVDQELGWLPRWIGEADRWRVAYIDVDRMKGPRERQVEILSQGNRPNTPPSAGLKDRPDWNPVKQINVQLFDDVDVGLDVLDVQATRLTDITSGSVMETWYATARVQGGWGNQMLREHPELANLANSTRIVGSETGWIHLEHLVINGKIYRIRPIMGNAHAAGHPIPHLIAEFDPDELETRERDFVGDSTPPPQKRSREELLEDRRKLFETVPYWKNLDESERERLLRPSPSQDANENAEGEKP